MIVTPFFLTALLAFAQTAGKRLVIFPGRSAVFSSYNDFDRRRQGNSEIIACEREGRGITLRYLLREGFIRPFAGVRIDPGSILDLSDYDALIVRIDPGSASAVRIAMLSPLDGYTKADDYDTYLLMQNEISAGRKRKEYLIPFDRMTIPSLWHEEQLSAYDPRVVRNFSRIRYIDFSTGISQVLNVENEIVIESITAVCTFRSALLRFSPIMLLYLPLLIILIVRGNFRTGKSCVRIVATTRAGTAVSEISDSEEGLVIEYIGENFSDRMLTVRMVSQKTGISRYRIPEIIKEKYNMSFPQYINTIRLAEAKRLLSESDRKISEISAKVGFASVNHFNRLFRAQQNCSPAFFRKNNKG